MRFHRSFPLMIALAGYALTFMPGVAEAQTPRLVKDINPGVSSSSPSELQEWGGALFCFARTANEGTEPWLSDGTDAGTQLLLDINPGSASSISSTQLLRETTAFGGWLYFLADDGTHGLELWRTDGSSVGTSLFFDFEPGSGGSSPQLMVLGNQLFISAYTASTGRELWVSDGNASGTQLFADLYPGPDSGIFFAREQDGVLFMSAQDGVHGLEPWICDGTLAGLKMLADINPGTGNGYTSALSAAWGGEIFFTAQDGGVSGRELWATDKTPAGTRMVLDINPGSADSFPYLLRTAQLSTGLLFIAETDANGIEPWISDGTAQGTSLLMDVEPGPSDSDTRIVDLGPAQTMFRATTSASGREAYVTDGTTSGTSLVDLVPGQAWGVIGSLTKAEDKAYFRGRDASGNRDIGVSDGTVAGTRLLGNLPEINFSAGNDPLAVEDKVFFIWNVFTGYSDGTTEFTNLLQRHPTDSNMDGVLEAARVGDLVFFKSSNDSQKIYGRELWVIDADFDSDGVMTPFDGLNVLSSCFCDGLDAPCGNGDANAGCVNSRGMGASLAAAGSSLVTSDDLVLTTSNLPRNAFGLMFMGPAEIAPAPLADGLRCVGGSLRRYGIQSSGPSGMLVYGPGLGAYATANFPADSWLLVGTTWHFQSWYRNVSGPCGSGSNLSNSVSVFFTP